MPEGAGEFRLPSADQSFVIGTVVTPVGRVPLVGSELCWLDRLGHWRVRWNIGRDRFRVEPGLYALNRPDTDSPVVVTANYKLSFDVVRAALAGLECWILVLDTKGINVWCAAGKGTFGTEELLDRIQASRLQEVVNHRRLILPQLGATGVAAHEVKKYSGFRVIYGPVSITELPAFLAAGMKAAPTMRKKEFPLRERLVLVPVEIMQALQQVVFFIIGFFLLAGLFGDGPFLTAAWQEGWPMSLAALLGIVAGSVLTPLLLPWIPVRPFSGRGALMGLALAVVMQIFLAALTPAPPLPVRAGAFLVTVVLASWYGMAFTGASTFTSLNGVRREMLRAMPLQFIGLLTGIGLWLVAFWIR